MTWTYSGTPNTSDRDAVRFMVGDTDTADQLITDEEIAYLLAEEGTPGLAAARAAEAIAAKFARKSDYSKSVGDLSLSESWSQRAATFLALAARLQQSGQSRINPVPRVSTKSLGPEFIVGQFDNFPGL